MKNKKQEKFQPKPLREPAPALLVNEVCRMLTSLSSVFYGRWLKWINIFIEKQDTCALRIVVQIFLAECSGSVPTQKTFLYQMFKILM